MSAFDAITIDPDGEKQHGVCGDCGSVTRSVWGYVANQDRARAAYFMRWTDGHVERGAQILVSIGGWGEGAQGEARDAIAIELRIMSNGPAFMVVDTATSPWADADFLGRRRTRAEVLADPIRFEVFAILDRLVADEPRLRAFLRNARVE